MILITLIFSSIALALFVIAMIYAIHTSMKAQKFRRSITRVINHVSREESKYWEQFEPTDTIVFSGYISKDGYATEFYKEKPVEEIDNDGNLRYYEAAYGDEEVELPEAIAKELKCIVDGEVRNACIKIIVGKTVKYIKPNTYKS